MRGSTKVLKEDYQRLFPRDQGSLAALFRSIMTSAKWLKKNPFTLTFARTTLTLATVSMT